MTDTNTSAGWGFDYNDPDVLARQNTTPNATCDIDGVFYDLQNAVHEITALAAERDKLRQLDEEAATHVETVIAMRTGFTGNPPYVGWKGLGLALTEALDERDALLDTHTDKADAWDVMARKNETIADLRLAVAEARNAALDEAAMAAIIPCCETRHVTLGDKVRDAILSLKTGGNENG